MAETITFRVEGLSELGERLKTLSSDMSNKIARASTAAAAVVIRNAAQQKVAVDTGNLKRNIIVKRLPKSETGDLTSAHIVTVRKAITKKQRGSGLKSAYYASFIEYGTVKMAARPFMRPAFDQNKEKAIEAMKDRIEQRLKKAGA